MCSCYSFFAPGVKATEVFPGLAGAMGASGERPDTRRLRPRDRAPVIIADAADDGRAALAWMGWGLVPSWAGDGSVGGKCFNARAESVFEKTAFRAAARARRCVVPATAFFEWSADGGRRRPWILRDAGGADLLFAGVWEESVAAAHGRRATFAILTRAAAGEVAAVHGREPVLFEVAEARRWMEPWAVPGELRELLAAPRRTRLRVEPARRDLLTRAPGDDLLTPDRAGADGDGQLDLFADGASG